MREAKSGIITAQFTVWCGNRACAIALSLKLASTRAGAKTEAMCAGWVYTRAYGWLCPACKRALKLRT